jgi:hypothetical protein
MAATSRPSEKEAHNKTESASEYHAAGSRDPARLFRGEAGWKSSQGLLKQFALLFMRNWQNADNHPRIGRNKVKLLGCA